MGNVGALAQARLPFDGVRISGNCQAGRNKPDSCASPQLFPVLRLPLGEGVSTFQL
jgi:hypothetical protein